MSRSPVAVPSRPSLHRSRGGTLLGILIGFVLGLGVAAALAFVLTRMPNPFDARSAKSDVANPNLSSVEREAAKPGERPRFDFSKILPGTEDHRAAKDEPAGIAAAPAGDRAASDKPVALIQANSEAPVDKALAGKYFLQAGAYQNAADAEDQRAKLALMGIEASMQSVEIPDKGTVNRIRLGPYSSVDEMNQVKADLLRRGVTTAVIKNP